LENEKKRIFALDFDRHKMPDKEYETEKRRYFSIGEIAGIFSETVETIRYWSDKFEGIINPDRNKKGDRMFSPEDLKTFKIIHNLVIKKGMTLNGAKKRIIENREGEDKDAEIVSRLENIKALLLNVKKTI
jgi:DNA-binding transcriptional MerR regulator